MHYNAIGTLLDTHSDPVLKSRRLPKTWMDPETVSQPKFSPLPKPNDRWKTEKIACSAKFGAGNAIARGGSLE
jgi:hypothetical protein